MATKWTGEQQAAISAKGKLTVLSAAAGSGKTTVLVEKALRLILDEKDKIDASRLLIVTFSNASAREFKNNIEKGINNAIKSDPSNSYIKTQKVALQKADISTIHAFCIKLVRENFELLDISPDFTIADDARSLVLHDKAIEKAMEYGYTLPDFGKFVTLFGKSSQDDEVQKFLKEMNHYFSALPFPKQRVESLSRLLDEQDFKSTEIYTALLHSVEEKLSYGEYLVSRENEIYDLGFFDGYYDGLLQDVAKFQSLQEAFDNGQLDRLLALAKMPLEKVGTAKPKCEYSEAIQNVRKKIKDMLEDITSLCEYLDEDRYETQKAQTSGYIHVMSEVFVHYQDILMEFKRAQKTFEFSDFEHFAVQLLVDERGNRTPLALSLQEKYVQIMEDEFQDTSFVQDMIFTSIAKENESNLFVVGDVKQSIYGFRKASPEIFLEKRQRGINDPTIANSLNLPHNFRSEKQLIDAINYVFERIMTKEVGSVDYKSTERLEAPAGKAKTAQLGVEIEICQKDEPAFVAGKIKSMIDGGYQIVENGEKRSVTTQDFCILLRNTKNFKAYASALESCGIKAYVKDDELVLNKPEVQSVISVLRVINNPLQEVYIVAGMFGDLFGFSLDEILEIKLEAKKERLYKALLTSSEPKAQAMLETLKDFSSAAGVYSVDKLIHYIIKKTGYYSRLALSENGESKRENLRWFISFAKSYANSYQGTLSDFTRWIDIYIRNGKGTGTTFQRPQGHAAIMTMHNSKGLQFPICFVSSLGTQFNKMDQTKRLMIDTRLGMATYTNEKFGYNTSTAGVQAIKEKILQTLADDEMRLLYVAFTRAKNLMVLTAQYGNVFTKNTATRLMERTGQSVHPYAVKKATSPMEWVLLGYLNHPAVADCVFSTPDAQSDDFLSFEIAEESTDRQETPPEIKTLYHPGEKELAQMEKELSWQYEDIAKTRLPIKLSAGQITKAPMPIILQKPFFAKEQTATAAQRGTEMHRFAQYTNILLARANIKNELQRLENLKLIDSKLLNFAQIEKFVYSPVAEIILNAEKVYTEKEFLVPYSAQQALENEEYSGEMVLVQGVIDCAAINGQSAVIIDYKTDRVTDMQQLYDRYHKQLELYRYASAYLFELKDIKCIIYSFHLDDYMEF